MGVRCASEKFSITTGCSCLLPRNEKASDNNAITASTRDNRWSDIFHIIAAEYRASVLNITFHRPFSFPTIYVIPILQKLFALIIYESDILTIKILRFRYLSVILYSVTL